MTLDILHFIDNKGGNASEIKESQRKRGGSVELIDEVIAMYTEWVKSELVIAIVFFFSFSSFSWLSSFFSLFSPRIDATLQVDYDINIMRKKVNEIQKQISTKKKVCVLLTCII